MDTKGYKHKETNLIRISLNVRLLHRKVYNLLSWLNRRVPNGTHGGVRGRNFLFKRNSSYSIVIRRGREEEALLIFSYILPDNEGTWFSQYCTPKRRIIAKNEGIGQKAQSIQCAQIVKNEKGKLTKWVWIAKKLSTMQKRKNRKNWVIHEVIHIIHRKVGKKSGLHSKIIECLFCEEIIKLSDFVESLEKLLTFQI